MKKAVKYPLTALGILLGLGLLVFLVFLGVNWRDTGPSPAALRLTAAYQNRVPVADKDNAYVYAMGFSSDLASDPIQLGRLHIQWINAQAAQPHPDYQNDPYRPDTKNTKPPEFTALWAACKAGDARCFNALEAHSGQIPAWLNHEAGWLNRYQALLQYTQWYESATPDFGSPLAQYAPLLHGQKLYLTKAWWLATQAHADINAVRGILESDMRFWRMSLANTDNMVYKMLAVRALTLNFMIGNLILRRLPPPTAEKAMPSAWRAPFSPAERSLRRCLSAEYISFERMFKSLRFTDVSRSAAVVATAAYSSTYQAQDTANQRADYLENFINTFENTPYAQLDRTLKKIKQADAARAKNYRLRRLYNPLGDYLNNKDAPDYTDYPPRTFDLEGARQAAVLMVTLRAQTRTDAEIAAFIHDSPLRNPYTQQPFVWDKHARTLTFVGLALDDELARHAYLY